MRIFFLFMLPIFCLLSWEHRDLYCQETGFRYIRNYTPKEYKSRSQNFSIVQDTRGIIYIGNNGGLLEYDGVSWREYTIPNSTVFSLALDDTGTLFIGGENEFGVLKPAPNGSLQYESLRSRLEEEEEYKNISDVRRIHCLGSSIYFRSPKVLVRLHNGHITPRKPELSEKFNGSYDCGGKLYIRQNKIGLRRVKGNNLEAIPDGEIFADKKIFMMAPYDSQRLLIGTRKNGFYLYAPDKPEPFKTEADKYIEKNGLSHGIRLKSSSPESPEFALATLRGGLVIIDSEGRIKYIFNEASGLQVNNVKKVFEDNQGNLWLALGTGVSKIEYSSPISFYEKRTNLRGLVQSVTRHGPDNTLYAGTSEGLYSLAPSSNPDSQGNPVKFQIVPDITIECWSLLSIGDSLLAATTKGIFNVNDRKNGKIIKNASYILVNSRKDKNRVWVGTKRGVVSLYLQKDRWIKEPGIENINMEIRTIAEDDNGDLWLGPLTKGVLKVDFPSNGTKGNPKVKTYGEDHGLPSMQVCVFWAAGNVLFATRQGIYRFDVKTGNFLPDSSLGDEFTGGPNGTGVFRIVEDLENNIWFHSKLRNILAERKPDNTFSLIKEPFLRIPPAQVNAIFPDPGGKAIWFAGIDGLIRYDTAIKKDYHYDFATIIRKVMVNGKLIFHGYKDNKEEESKTGLHPPEIEYEDRNIRFEFAAPFFEDESATQYRCFLAGYENDWSDWSPETWRDYTNLDSGFYTFRVKARNVYRHKIREAVFQFKIFPPWYKAWWAFSIYAIVFLSTVFYIVKWRSGKLEREKAKLEHTVKERTGEVNEKNQQLEDQTIQLKEQSEKLKEMDKVKSRFFANISHEFRTPLTLIMGPLEQMITDAGDKHHQKTLNMMMRNSQRLLALINQLLELSKIESGKMKLQAARHNIIPFLKGFTASFESVAAKNELDLTFSAEEENISLYFDPGKLEDIIFNLISNSVKFTPPGGKITVTASRKQPDETGFPAGSATISVNDTGPGIPRDQLEHIFDRFYQSDSTYEHHGKGSGIGLTIAKELVALHQGRIDVHSHEGKGTEFIICLPMPDPGPGPGVPADDKGVPGVQTDDTVDYRGMPGIFEAETMDNGGTTKTAGEKNMDVVVGDLAKNIILVVEDNTDARNYIRDSLESLYNIAEAKDGKEGIEKARLIIPDLIISDIMMPGVDGYELCRVLKNDVKTSHIPTILLTAKASEEDIVTGLETGADDYITKPFNTRILSARIKNLIDLRSQQQQTQKREMTLQPVKMDISQIDKTFIRMLKEVIKENIADPDFNIERMCKKMDMSQPTLYRKIHALTGESPTEFIRSYRLKQGAKLLKNNFGTVVEVAFEVGFSSANYFTKCFKKRFHQLPTTYKESVG